MKGFWLILLWMLAYKEISKLIVKKTTVNTEMLGYSIRQAVILMIPIIYWAATRSNAFGDTVTYDNTYKYMPIGNFLKYISDDGLKDRGFYAAAYFLKFISNGNRYAFFGTFAVIQGFCLIYAYYKYSSDYWLSILLFIISTDYYAWMFNGMRQFTAVAVLFACIPLILNKNYKWFIIITVLISTIHQSALVMIPTAFIVQGKAFNKKTMQFMFLLIFSIVIINQATEFVEGLLDNTAYGNVDLLSNDDGTNILRVLVYAVPTMIAVIKRDEIANCDNPVINLAVNMSIISTSFYILSKFTSGIFIGRMPIYFSLYNYILLPWEIKNLFKNKDKMLIYFTLFAAYLFFYYYQIHMIWGLM